MRKFVTQLVRRLPKNFADAVPEAAERLEVEQTQVAILLPREPVVALLVAGRLTPVKVMGAAITGVMAVMAGCS